MLVQWLRSNEFAPRLLVVVALLTLVATIPCAAALIIDGRTLNGVSVWIKPLKFQTSGALHLVTCAWALTLLPKAQQRRQLVVALAVALVIANIFEVAYITAQAARGQPSHFNMSSTFTRMAYSIMGMMAIILVGAAAWLGLLILQRADTGHPIVLAAGIGLTLGGILGGLTGVYLGGQPDHWVGGTASDLGGVPIFGWSRTGGDLRVAHFVGLHIMQVLPLAALAMTRVLPFHWCRPLIGVGAVIGTLVTAITFLQALRSQPLWPTG
jgi:hypothetical protein